MILVGSSIGVVVVDHDFVGGVRIIEVWVCRLMATNSSVDSESIGVSGRRMSLKAANDDALRIFICRPFMLGGPIFGTTSDGGGVITLGSIRLPPINMLPYKRSTRSAAAINYNTQIDTEKKKKSTMPPVEGNKLYKRYGRYNTHKHRWTAQRPRMGRNAMWQIISPR